MNKKLSLRLLSTCVLLSITKIAADSFCCDRSYFYGKTHFSQRPQGNNQALVFVGTSDKTHLIDNKENYLNFNISLGYRQNFDSCDIGKYFFTERGPLNVGIVNTNVDVQNLQLGLASNFKGTAILEPTVKECLADFDVFIGLDKWVQGLWGRLRLPFVSTSWNPKLSFSNNEVGTSVYPDGFATTSGTAIDVVYRSLDDALCDGSPLGQIPALEAGRIGCKKSCYGLSDIHFEIGYDFFRKQRGNMGIALVAAAPTGVPTPSNCNRFLFSPSIGSQRSWQIGAALRGQVEIFNQEANHKRITIYGDLRALHLCKGCNRRLLSLWANDTSAFNYWLILNRYNEQGTFLNTERAANLLNKKVKVSAAAMVEFTLMAQMLKDNWDLSIGYNFWSRSQECLTICDNCLGNGADYYAIKDPANWGTHIYDKTVSDIANENNSLAANASNLGTYALFSGNINPCVAQHPATYSNMLFGYLGYNFSKTWLKPYLGVSLQVEFGRGNTALNMWGAYIKGGISF